MDEFDKLLKRRLQNDVQLFNEIPLYLEKVGSLSGNAYNAIFGEGNSFESIFEISYVSSNTDNQNSYAGSFFTHVNNNQVTSGNLVAYDGFYDGLPTKNTELFTTGFLSMVPRRLSWIIRRPTGNQVIAGVRRISPTGLSIALLT